MVIPQRATESLTACDLAGSAAYFIARFDDPIAEPLMISFSMIMGNVFLSGITQRSVAEENHAVKAFFFYGSNETFKMCRQIRRSGRQANTMRARLLNQFAKRRAVLAITIHEQIPLMAQEPIQRVSEIPTHLHHPGFRGIAGAAGQLHPPSGQLQHKK
jgi:hypothetical protein